MAATRSAPFQAALEIQNNSRVACEKLPSKTPLHRALLVVESGKPVEMTAQVVNAMVQDAFGVGLEDHRDILRLSSRQSAFYYPAFLVGSERRAGVAEHIHGQWRLTCGGESCSAWGSVMRCCKSWLDLVHCS